MIVDERATYVMLVLSCEPHASGVGSLIDLELPL